MATSHRAAKLVLLHGFTHTRASWSGVVAALAEGYRPLALDIRGHGSASRQQPVTLQTVIADIGAAAPARFVLVGYSMGGRIALHFALAQPERVSRLVLIGASPGIEEAAGRRARREADNRLANQIEGMTIDEFARRWAQVDVLADQPAKVREAAHNDRLLNRPDGLARALRGLGTGALPPLWGRLGELAMPVTLVVGERDHKFQAIAQEMAALIARVRVVVVPGAGHAVHLEAPEALAGAIRTGQA